jgi:hypothetical protein
LEITLVRAASLAFLMSLLAGAIGIAGNIAEGESAAWRPFAFGTVLMLLIATLLWAPALRLLKPTELAAHVALAVCVGWLGGFAFIYALVGWLDGFKTPLRFVQGASMSSGGILGWSAVWALEGAAMWLWCRRDLQPAVEGDGPAFGGPAP